jgi:hypothetical protein
MQVQKRVRQSRKLSTAPEPAHLVENNVLRVYLAEGSADNGDKLR